MITENLSTLKIHKLTQAQYNRELAAGNIDPNALYLTPDENGDFVYVVDIVNDLTTDVADKPLSAAQGVALKALIDAITVPTKVSDLENDSGYITSIPDEYITETELNAKGYLTTVTSEDVIHNGSKLSDTLDTQSDKMDLIISSTSSGQTSTISIHTEDMNDWILQEGYWEGSYISTGV